MRTCPSCGQANPVQAKFCADCGAALRTAGSEQEVRKTVSVVFCDVTGSTALGEVADPETVRRVMSRYFEESKRVLESHGGVVEKFIGDAVMAVFGIPQVHEDDALRAVRAAVGIREAIEDLNRDLEARHGTGIAIRTGVNTGEVVAGDPASGQALVTGDAVNVAARLEQAAAPGEILIGPTTQRLVKDAVSVEAVEPLELKGKSEPMPAFRVLDVSATRQGTARRLDSPLVGRSHELSQLRDLFDSARADDTCRLCTVVGTAGLGKSRLTAEFLSSVDARSVVGRCLPYGDGITFWPVLEIIDQLAALRDDDEPQVVQQKLRSFLGHVDDADLIGARIAALIGIGESASSVEETFWAVRRFLEAAAVREPLIVVVDDIHWAEPTLLDLIEYVASGSRETAMLFLTTARPELLDIRSAWARSVPDATTIVLEPISPDESEELLRNLLGRADLPAELKERITEAAEGTPLFVEEMFSMLVDEGTLAYENGAWVQRSSVERIEVPPTIQALLAARLDRLAAEERQVLGCAAVAGKTFWSGAVSRLWSANGGSATPQLLALVRKDLIQPDSSTLAGQDAYRFRHILIRDAAYESLSKEKRIGLHRTFADWLVDSAGDRAREYDEIVAYHLETAVGLAYELGPLSSDEEALAEKAAGLLDDAGHRAFERGDLPAATTLLSRAVALMRDDRTEYVDALFSLVGIYLEMGMFEEANESLARARDAAAKIGNERLNVLLELHDARKVLLMNEASTAGGLADKIHSLLPQLEAIGDQTALAQAWGMIGYTHGISCRAMAQVEALRKAIEHARAAGNLREEIDAAWWACFAICQGPTPASRMRAEADVMLAPVRGKSRLIEMVDLIVEANVRAYAGDLEEAVKVHERSRAVAIDTGYLILGWSGVMETAWLLTPYGEFERALRYVQEGNEALKALGETGYRSTVLLTMAAILYELGRYDEASATLDEVERISWADDIVNNVQGRSVRAKLLALGGDADGADRSAREALEIYDQAHSDFAAMRAQVLLDVSEAHRLSGRLPEAGEAAREALQIVQAKQHVGWVERASKQLERIEARVGSA